MPKFCPPYCGEPAADATLTIVLAALLLPGVMAGAVYLWRRFR